MAKSGQFRKAAVALGELANREQDAASWVRLGVMLLRAGREAAAIAALKQGQWLHRTARSPRRAEVVARLVAQAQQAKAA